MSNSILNNPQSLMNSFQQFRASYRGNPQQEVMQMVQSGQISQQQLQQVIAQAQQMLR